MEPTPSDDGLIWDDSPGPLRRPILVAAFEGWNDAADAATFAAGYLAQHGGAERVAHIDPETHTDFQSRRPQVELVEGVTRSIVWPTSAFWVARYAERDLVVLRGIEPSYRWKSFCRAVLEVYRATGLRDGRHLRRAAGRRAPHPQGPGHRHRDRRRAHRAGSRSSRRATRGPPGSSACCTRSAGPAASRRCRCGRRCRTTSRRRPTRRASAAILDRFGKLTGITLDLSRVQETVQRWRVQVDQVAADDDDIRGYVERLEARFDEADDDTPEWGDELPTGDEIANELEQYLREQRGE